MVTRTRWTKARTARAIFLCGRGETELRIARDPSINSTMVAVRDMLRGYGLVARRDSDLEVLVAVPAAVMPTIAAVARARGQRERAEDLLTKMIAALAEEPGVIANVLDDVDDPAFNGRLKIELGRLAANQKLETFKMNRSARTERKRRGSSAAPHACRPEGMATMKFEPNTVFEGALIQARADRIATYLAGPRPLARVPLDDLETRFVETLQLALSDEGSEAAKLPFREVTAEYAARGIDPPFATHPELTDTYRASVQKMFDNLSAKKRLELNGAVLALHAAHVALRH